jgi:hypothetical protein
MVVCVLQLLNNEHAHLIINNFDELRARVRVRVCMCVCVRACVCVCSLYSSMQDH